MLRAVGRIVVYPRVKKNASNFNALTDDHNLMLSLHMRSCTILLYTMRSSLQYL